MNPVSLFSEQKVASFSYIPIVPPSPTSGQTWSITWHKKDRDLIAVNDTVVECVSDSDEQTWSFCAGVAGQLRIAIPTQRYVPQDTPLGTLDYGLAFEAFLSRQAKKAHQAWQKAMKHRHDAKRCYALEAQQVAAQQQHVTAQRAINGRLAEKIRQFHDHPDAALPLSTYVSAFVQRLDEAMKDTALPATLFSQLAALEAILDRLFSTTPLPQPAPEDQLALAGAALEKLYALQGKRFSAAVPDLPPDLREETRWLWDQLRQTHLALLKQYETVDPYPLEGLSDDPQ